MKLLGVTDRWDERGGGRERYVAELTRWLARRAWTVEVFCRDIRRVPARQPEPYVRACGGFGFLGERRLREAVARYRCLHPAAPVLATRPIAGATHYQLHSGLHARAYEAEHAAFESILRRTLYWPAMRLNSRRRMLLEAEERLLANGMRPHLMVFSTRARDELQSVCGIPPSHVAVAPLGVDLEVFHPARSGHDDGASGTRPLRLLFAGHNFGLKGLAPLLTALAALAESGVDATLTVAGSGPARSFRRLAARRGVAGRVDFAGNVSQMHLAELYRTHHALVHPTFYDPFPRVVLEALGHAVALGDGRLDHLALADGDQPVPAARGDAVALVGLQLGLDQPAAGVFPQDLGPPAAEHPRLDLGRRGRPRQVALERQARAGADVQQLDHVRPVVGDQVQLEAPGLVDAADVFVLAAGRLHGRGALRVPWGAPSVRRVWGARG